MSLHMMVVCTDLHTRFVPEWIAKAAGAKGNGKQHWTVARRVMQWAEWMDRCDASRVGRIVRAS